MKMIKPFTLNFNDGPQFIEMPAGAELISVGTHNAIPTIWALCEIGAEPERRYYQLIFDKQAFDPEKLAHPDVLLPKPMKFIGTVQLARDQINFHVFMD